MFKKIILMLAILSVTVGCSGTSSYIRGTDGSVTATGGNVFLGYSPDGKIIISEAFIANDPTGFFTKIFSASQSGQPINIAALIQLLQGLAAAPVTK